MLLLIFGVLKVAPVSSKVPPEAELYQLILVPEVPLRETLPDPHRDPSCTSGTGGVVVIIAWTGIRILGQVDPADT